MHDEQHPSEEAAPGWWYAQMHFSRILSNALGNWPKVVHCTFPAWYVSTQGSFPTHGHVPRRTKSLEGGPSSGPRRRSATIQGKRSSWWRQIGHTRTSWLILLCLIWDVCGWSCGFGLGCRELVLYLDGFQPCVQDELSRVIYGGH